MELAKRSSLRKLSPTITLGILFQRIKRFLSMGVSSPFALSHIRLSVGCPEIEIFRESHPGKAGDRAFMHTHHKKGAICSAPDAAHLSDNFKVGLFLHEFGHLGSDGGEQAADEWILANYHIMIHYMGPLGVEWVSDQDLARVLGRRA